MFELFAGGPQIEQQKKRRDLGGRHHHIREPMLAKKYDRNCELGMGKRRGDIWTEEWI
jgi:hypothetical protein